MGERLSIMRTASPGVRKINSQLEDLKSHKWAVQRLNDNSSHCEALTQVEHMPWCPMYERTRDNETESDKESVADFCTADGESAIHDCETESKVSKDISQCDSFKMSLSQLNQTGDITSTPLGRPLARKSLPASKIAKSIALKYCARAR